MRTITLDQVLACPNLPSLSTVAVEVLALTQDQNVRLTEIARVVQNDQALAAKILKTVNSSYYGLAKPCPSITRALTYLGLSTVKSLVLGFSLVDMTRQSDGAFDLIDYWRRCVYSAAATRRIVLITAVADPEEAFIAALMQDLGMPAIHSSLGHDYASIVKETGGDHDKLRACETTAMGFHHAEAGAKLGERWRLPPAIVQTIRHHFDPSAASDHLELVRAVALGYQAAATLSMADPSGPLARFRRNASEWFALSSAQSTELLSQVSEDARELARLFRVNTGDAPDVQAILGEAEEASLNHQVAMQRETDQLRQTNDDLAKATVTDALTGVGNRKQFDRELAIRFEQARSFNGSLAVIMVDADKFKTLNDTHGHPAGDAVLVEIARRMSKAADGKGLVCRYGGEEFVVIAPGADRKAGAVLAETIRRAIDGSPIDVSSLKLPVSKVNVTVSLGLAVMDSTNGSRITAGTVLTQMADKALYAAKQAGRNCVRMFSVKQAVGAV